jgi:DNA polymerase-3 subunit beta
MKIIFNRNQILEAALPLLSATSGKPFSPATGDYTEGIKIEANFPDTCTMTTYDLQKGVKITVEAKVLEEGSVIVSGQKFIQTLRVMDGEEITFSVDDKMAATIVSGRSSHKMIAIDGNKFPKTPDLTSDRSFIVGQAILRKMISKVDFAMGTKDQRVILNGAFFKIDDESIMTVACDGFKSAKCKSAVELENKNTNGNRIA